MPCVPYAGDQVGFYSLPLTDQVFGWSSKPAILPTRSGPAAFGPITNCRLRRTGHQDLANGFTQSGAWTTLPTNSWWKRRRLQDHIRQRCNHRSRIGELTVGDSGGASVNVNDGALEVM